MEIQNAGEQRKESQAERLDNAFEELARKRRYNLSGLSKPESGIEIEAVPLLVTVFDCFPEAGDQVGSTFHRQKNVAANSHQENPAVIRRPSSQPAAVPIFGTSLAV